MFKVLFLIDHAPDYRESFLHDLGSHCSLTVVAHPCEKDNLIPSVQRQNYHYIELQKTYGNNIRFNFGLKKIIKEIQPDILCIALNFHYPIRIINFLLSPFFWRKWIWWGQIYGRSENKLLNRIKLYLLQRSFGTLVYSDEIKERVQKESKANLNLLSFNNSQFSASAFSFLTNNINEKLHCLFVGRPQKRKRLEILIDLARRKKDVIVRLVGPGMQEFFKEYIDHESIQLFEGASGEELKEHFVWSNIILNPGHAGLLIMNAAAHNRAIVLDSKVEHAPEVILAKETKQFFIDFQDRTETDNLLDKLKKEPDLYVSKAKKLYDFAISKYTTEQMVNNHMKMFEQAIKAQ